jgi:hypothetical protein
MDLRLDRLLAALRDDPAAILSAIDADPLLAKRTSGDLVLANATKALFTPQLPHQLYAKGIVFRRDPYRLVSLPLLKFYNLGEREWTVHDLAALVDGVTHSRLHFLRKLDGTLAQRFWLGGRAWFTTRGVIEGARYTGAQDEDAPEKLSHFDFLGETRRIAAEKYPVLLAASPELERLSLVFEFIHPETQVITDYGLRRDLVLLAAFHQAEFRYLPHHELEAVGAAHGLTVVDAFHPRGHTLPEKIDDLLTHLKGTDHEGTVLTVERDREVIYRVKVKSPDYLKILRMVVTCTYARTADLLDLHPEWTGWADVEAHLRSLGNDQVPEEVLGFYREHFDTHRAYLANCERVREWVQREADAIKRTLPPGDERATRKAFAEVALTRLLSPLLFVAFAGRLTVAKVREVVKTPDEAAEAVGRL